MRNNQTMVLTGHKNSTSPWLSCHLPFLTMTSAFYDPLNSPVCMCMHSLHALMWLLNIIFIFALIRVVHALCCVCCFCMQLHSDQTSVSTVSMRLLARETWQPASHSGAASASQDTLLPNDFLYCAQQISSTLAEFVSVFGTMMVQIISKGDSSVGRFKLNELAWTKWHV